MSMTVAAAVSLTSCSTPAAESVPVLPWAAEAEAVVSLLETAYDAADGYEMARFFTDGGTLDLTVWGLGVGTTPAEVVQMFDDLRAASKATTGVAAQHLFVSLDGAAVWWYAPGEDGIGDWVQTYTFGDGGRTASRAFRSLGVPHRPAALEEHTVLTLTERYLEAWNGDDPAAFEDVYASGATLIDDVRHTTWRGLDDIMIRAGSGATTELGPWPSVFTYRSGGQVEAIVILQKGGSCPTLEAKRWSLDGDRIALESTYLHVPSARRCLVDLDDGWWTTFELGPSLDDNITGILDAAGRRVDLVNAEAAQMALSQWMMGRFERAGLGVPDVRAIWFPPSPDCAGRGGLAIESDDRYEGSHTVLICASEDRIESGATASGWAPSVLASGLHELAHVWMLDHLDDETREAFLERAELTVWRGSGDAIWRRRGVEHAAFTIAWGLAGTDDARYPILPPPPCEELTDRFELLTGRSPITRCEGRAE